MSTLKTFRFSLAPDREIPRFRRFQWELVDVSITDVLLHGIHPWMGPDQHPTLLHALVQRMNADAAKVGDLVPMGHSHDIAAESGYVWSDNCRFQRTLRSIQEEVYFVDGLTYLELLNIAKERLRGMWSHHVAKTLAEKAHPGFPELRRFLKTKDRRLKLCGYEDVDRYDLSQVLRLDDFDPYDKLLVAEGVPSHNFRRIDALKSVSDEQGRLRLVPEIRCCSLAVITRSDNPRLCGTHVLWHITRSGQTLTFRPDLGASLPKRDAAVHFARCWRTDQGRLVFRTTLEKLEEICRRGEGVPAFPALAYAGDSHLPTAAVEVTASSVTAYRIGRFPTRKCTVDELRQVLRDHGVSMTGTKEELIAKLAALAAVTFEAKKAALDDSFKANRYLRIATAPSETADLPALNEIRHLRNLLLAMYALRHLRGNVVLETSHENATCSIEELALALLHGKVAFEGALVRVA
jgi:hypothetical protein